MDAAKAKYKVNDPVFILDKEWARVFPAIITEVENPKVWYTGYKLKLDQTPGVHDELSFNGICKPAPFNFKADKSFSGSELFKTKADAYHALIREYEDERESLRERLKDLPKLKKMATERLERLNKAEGCVYPVGSTVWFISKKYSDGAGKVTEATVTQYDRGDFQDKPYYVTGKDCWQNTAWVSAADLFKSKEEAVKALKEKLKAEYEKHLAEIE